MEKNLIDRMYSKRDYEVESFRKSSKFLSLVGNNYLHYFYDENKDVIVFQHGATMDVLSKQQALELIELLTNYVEYQEYYEYTQLKARDSKINAINNNSQVNYNNECKKDITAYVYLMQDIDNKNIKIGVSKNPKERLSQLRAGNPSLKLIYQKVINNAYDVEEYLHIKFNHKAIGREWFDLSDNDISKIKKYLISLSKDGDM